VNKGYVLLDYGHNPHALGAIAGMTRQSQYCRVTAVITVPGDRADWIIQEVGRVAARGFDRIIIREDQDLRGRAVGEIARLLESSILSERPDCDCSIVFEEQAALKRAMDEMRDGELVVFFYEELNQVMQVLEQAGACPVVRCEEQADVTAYA
jgi:cyanophycin synthetase